MANEAVIVELLGNKGNPIRFACATAMEKGTLCKMTSPRTIAAHAADNDPFAGVLAAETIVGDSYGTVYTCGLFDLTTAAAVTAGEKVSLGNAANKVSKVAAADCIFSDVGVALGSSVGADEVDVVAIGVYQ